MQIPKDRILEMIRTRGDDDQTAQADAELPDQVDTEKDKGLLDRFGINSGDLIGGLGSKFGL